MKEIPNSTIESMIKLGEMLLKFGRTNRITYHEDGVTPESDTDHTVMLSIIACAFASRFSPELDIGRIAQFSLVHDLVEVYAKDTPTLRIMSTSEKKEKEERETIALKRIEEEFGEEFSWLIETIKEYESLKLPEARFVKVVDKVMPKITHILNGGVTITKQGQLDVLSAIHEQQRKSIYTSYGADQPEGLELWDRLTTRLSQILSMKKQ
jgi:putative hydrolases of HD superfamily